FLLHRPRAWVPNGLETRISTQRRKGAKTQRRPEILFFLSFCASASLRLCVKFRAFQAVSDRGVALRNDSSALTGSQLGGAGRGGLPLAGALRVAPADEQRGQERGEGHEARHPGVGEQPVVGAAHVR